MSDGKISYGEPLEALANILEAIIDIILYGSTGVETEKLCHYLIESIPDTFPLGYLHVPIRYNDAF